MLRRFLARRKMRWAVRHLADMSRSQRTGFRMGREFNRTSKKLDHMLASMYTKATFSAFPILKRHD